MESLYKISEDLLQLFDEIEAAGGEITPKQDERLAISHEQLIEKLNNYANAVKHYKSNIEECKTEEKRIKLIKNKYENRINRLKSSMLNAVIEFGQNGKSNKFIELPTMRLYTKGTSSIVIDEERCNILIECFINYITELFKADIFYTGYDIDYNVVLEGINNKTIEKYGEDFPLFTMADIMTVRIEFKHTMTIGQLFTRGSNTLKDLIDPHNNLIINPDLGKDDCKTAIAVWESKDVPMTIAKIENSISLQMK